MIRVLLGVVVLLSLSACGVRNYTSEISFQPDYLKSGAAEISISYNGCLVSGAVLKNNSDVAMSNGSRVSIQAVDANKVTVGTGYINFPGVVAGGSAYGDTSGLFITGPMSLGCSNVTGYQYQFGVY